MVQDEASFIGVQCLYQNYSGWILPNERLPEKFAVRDVIHGFVSFNELEKDIINHPWFQRLRRIKQLAFTDYVYPGATHTRFAHSLGVMHLASRMFDRLLDKCICDVLECTGYKGKRKEQPFKAIAERSRQVLRLAALLHDIGHGPFSHSPEACYPHKDKQKHFRHEDYSRAALDIGEIGVLIRNSKIANKHFNPPITPEEVGRLFGERPDPEKSIPIEDLSTYSDSPLWYICKSILDSQLDADKLDYLLRDSHHTGVAYGTFDLDRIIEALSVCYETKFKNAEGGSEKRLDLAVDEDSKHVVEGVPIARYWMYTEVYFHKTRRIFDMMLAHALVEIIGSPGFSKPTSKTGLKKYFSWDDTKVIQELLSTVKGKKLPLSQAISKREHPQWNGHTFRKSNSGDRKGFKAYADKLFEKYSKVRGYKGSIWRGGHHISAPKIWMDDGLSLNPYIFSDADDINLKRTIDPDSPEFLDFESRLEPDKLSEHSDLVQSFRYSKNEVRFYVSRSKNSLRTFQNRTKDLR